MPSNLSGNAGLPPPTTALRHAGITVRDLERSASFYREFFGFEDVRRMEESGPFIERISGLPGVSVTTLKVRAPGGGMIELLQYHSPAALDRRQDIFIVGCSHVALTVTDAEAVYRRLRAAGLEAVSAPQESDDGSARVFFCRDPDGVLLEVVQELRAV